MFEADRDADEAGGDIDGCSFFGGQLCVCGTGGMGGDAAGVAKVGGKGEHFQVVEETTAAFETAFQFEADDAAAVVHLPAGNVVLGVAGEKGIF